MTKKQSRRSRSGESLMDSLMRQQFLVAKRQYPDAIVFFRLGDFYEAFDEDAEALARGLGWTLLRPSPDDARPWPMAGVPCASLEGYLPRLFALGYRVAVIDRADQVGWPGR